MSELVLSPLYDLLPKEGQNGSKWPEDWPNWGSPGVYVILDSELRISYIGKASMNSWLAARLSTYFKFGPNKCCELKYPDAWILKPKYVVVIPMDESHKFEAPALEEYLIGKLHPADNKAGRIKS